MINCPICNSNTDFFTGKKDRLGQTYHYYRCQGCRFLFEKDFLLDSNLLESKVSKLYAGDYFKSTDSGWKERGDAFVKTLHKFLRLAGFLKNKKNISVLDYGAGNGYITSKITAPFEAFYYDKYEKPTYQDNFAVLEKPEKKDVMYAVELVEHITNSKDWELFSSLCQDAFIFTTEVSDGIKKEHLAAWWYFNPDAGHTAIYSFQALFLLAKKYGFFYFFYPSKSTHFFIRSKLLSRVNIVALEYVIFKLVWKLKNL